MTTRAGAVGRSASGVGAAAAVVVVVAAAAAACAGGGGGKAEAADFCVKFPQRDAAVALRLPSDDTLRGADPATVKSLMTFAAAGVDDRAPVAIKSPVGTYVTALRAWAPGQDPMGDPKVAAAVGQINEWLRDNCAAAG